MDNDSRFELFTSILEKYRKYKPFNYDGEMYISESGVIVVNCTDSRSLRKDHVSKYAAGHSSGYSHVIFICNIGPASQAMMYLKTSPIRYEIFTLDEISYNPLAHYLSPVYEKIDSSCIEEPLENLFYVFETDIIVRFYGFSCGDVLRGYYARNPSKTFLRYVIEDRR